ncbi:MAG: cytochrome-c peroxidase [Thermoanaerobaculia bacterium]
MNRPLRPLLLVLAVSLLAACSGENDDTSRLIARSARVFGTIPDAQTRDAAALVSLGRELYFSEHLSANRSQSCNSCHPVDGEGTGADLLPTSPGALGAPGRRNTPTVLNAALHGSQFWDGRAGTLEEQAVGPILNPIEMAMSSPEEVEKRLRDGEIVDPRMIRAAFPDEQEPFTLDHAARALAAFERTLRTTDRFDAFQQGDRDALTQHEQRGLDLFMSYGCTSCHNGPLLGGERFQKIGIVNPYDNEQDRGRYEVTSKPIDQFVFKVPSLRNVAATPPYFHDGRIRTLEEAVERMVWHQLGTEIPPEDRDAIVAFLGSLSGKLASVE